MTPASADRGFYYYIFLAKYHPQTIHLQYKLLLASEAGSTKMACQPQVNGLIPYFSHTDALLGTTSA